MQTRGYRYFDLKSEFYDYKLAIKAAEILVLNPYNLLIFHKLKEIKATKRCFLKFCGVDDDFVAKNLDKIFKNLQNGDIYDDLLSVFSVLLDKAYFTHSDHNFDSQDVKNFMQNLAINSAGFKPKKSIKQDDLLVCFREFLVS